MPGQKLHPFHLEEIEEAGRRGHPHGAVSSVPRCPPHANGRPLRVPRDRAAPFVKDARARQRELARRAPYQPRAQPRTVLLTAAADCVRACSAVERLPVKLCRCAPPAQTSPFIRSSTSDSSRCCRRRRVRAASVRHFLAAPEGTNSRRLRMHQRCAPLQQAARVSRFTLIST